ncbi:unnamed protein product [Medioppia subpectinata]|uniref:K Homology domain-containing protein n=1 Tax=Medioppia subpectinata TaxID=1979941 RepID=A0A7R9LLJ8_9ACAR|nr:unnamed protein product [Medioppia subpectinata]CAG2119876.1 unnamed protein product [Medioppia subpectinata]
MLEDNWPNFGQHFPPAITAAMNLTVVSSTEVQPMPVDCQPPIQPIQSQLRRTGNEVRKYGPIDGKVHDKSDKYCEVVSVPTSTHVAQIVGKQGSKIKLLRAKSRTHIQTPVAGQEPVFIITGVREDVLKVKAEILSASDHFTAVSEERKQKFRQNSDVPGSVCLNLIIPSYMIGLIVGRNGNTIRNIQKITETYIETPKVCENSSFRITGVMRNVEIAKQYIIEHVKSKSNLPFRIDVLFNGDHKLTFN